MTNKLSFWPTATLSTYFCSLLALIFGVNTKRFTSLLKNVEIRLMKKNPIILSTKSTFAPLFFLLFLISIPSFSQRIYTQVPFSSCASPAFGTNSCWGKSGCGSGSAPTLSPAGTSMCPVVIQISTPITVTGNLSLGGNVTLNVNTGGNLTIIGSLIITKETDGNLININGGNLSVSGDISLVGGRKDNITSVQISTTNSGTLQVAGVVDLNSSSFLRLTGDNSGLLTTNDLTINQEVVFDILNGGSIKVNNLTKYAGNSSQINVYGRLVTSGLEIAGGGKGVELNALGSGRVDVLGDMEIKGESTISFGGSSTVNIEGSVKITGNSDLTSLTGGLFLSDSTSLTVRGDLEISGNAAYTMNSKSNALIVGSVYVSGSGLVDLSQNAVIIIEGGCGTYEDIGCAGGLFVTGNGRFVEIETAEAYICGQKPEANFSDGKARVTIHCDITDPLNPPPCAIYTSCRILSVEFQEIKLRFDPEKRQNLIEFTTVRERDNSHFDLERSTDGAKNFEPMGRISGSGWKDGLSEYEFKDDQLPLLGGNMFYRIRQTDFSGNSIVSKVFAGKVPAVSLVSTEVWRAYPNPSQNNQLKLDLINAEKYNNEELTIRIIHPRAVSSSFSSSKLREINDRIGILMEQIPLGVFVLEVVWGDRVEHHKILKN